MNRHRRVWLMVAGIAATLALPLVGCVVAPLPIVDKGDGSIAEASDTGAPESVEAGSPSTEAGPGRGDADAMGMTSDCSTMFDATSCDAEGGSDASDASNDYAGGGSDASDAIAAPDVTDGADELTPDATPIPTCPYSDWVDGACAPVCGTANFGPGGLVDGGLVGLVPGLSQSYDGLLSIDSHGRVLHIRVPTPQTSKLLLSIPSADASGGYETFTLVDTSNASAYPPIAFDIGTLSFDGSELIAAANSYDSFVEVPLSGTQLGTPTAGHFRQLNAALSAGGTINGYVVISADGLTLYYNVSWATDPSQSGLYEATRNNVTDDFAPGALLSGNGMQLFWDVTGVSSDDLTLFMLSPDFQTYVLSRKTKSDPWTADSVMSDGGLVGGMLNYFGAMPTADCRFMMAICTPGGAFLQHICELPRL